MKKSSSIYLLLFAFLLCGTVTQCETPDNSGDNTENPGNGDEEKPEPLDPDEGKVPGFLPGYPRGLSVVPFTDQLGSSKCSGFFAVADFELNPKLAFRPQFSSPKFPTKYFSDFTGGTPQVATNGGYFAGYRGPSLSLIVSKGQVLSTPPQKETFTKSNGTKVDFCPVRAALGQNADGSFDAAWIYCMSRDLNAPWAFPSPLGNDERTETFMTSAPTSSTPGARKWDVEYAIGAGPMLVYEGDNVAVENYWKEVFDYGGVSGTSRQPRTGIGFTADNKLILLVCDGRGENGSVGFTLAELADKFIALGCTHAINLDGGGSSTFVGKDGKVMNRPSDTADTAGAPIVMRDVPTAVVIAELD